MTAVLIGLAVSALVVALLARFPGLAPIDQPNPRSLHERPVARAGGWAIFAGWAAAAPFAGPPPGFSGASHATLSVSLAALFAISLVDDYRGVSPVWRILVQTGAALAVSCALAGFDPREAAFIATGATVLVAATNFFNFMDGSDGLAGTMAVTGFGACAAAAALAGAAWAPWLALAGACLPFLARNLPPARLFLGDAGSAPLGFTAGAAGLAGTSSGLWPAWFPLLVFLPFLADASATLARRAWRRERVWEAHRTHYYQRLVRQGAGHRGTLRVYGALMIGCAASAIACLAFAPAAGWVALAVWIAIVAAVFARIDYHVGDSQMRKP